jgi:hypothetical protein
VREPEKKREPPMLCSPLTIDETITSLTIYAIMIDTTMTANIRIEKTIAKILIS